MAEATDRVVVRRPGSRKSNLTLEPLIDEYTRRRIGIGEINRNTAYGDRLALLHFAETFGARQVKMLGRSHVETWLETILPQAPATRRKKLSTVKGFCRWLAVEGYVKRDPALGIRSPRQPRRLPRVLDHDSVTALLAVCPDARARLIVLLMVQLGLREGEVAALDLGNISDHSVFVRGKGGHERVLPLVPEVREALNLYLTERGGRAGALIQNHVRRGTGMKAQSIGQLIRRLCVEAGIKKAAHDGRSAHGLRRTMATDMLAAGADIIDVAEALGHANLSSVRHYAKYNIKRLETAMAGRSYTNRPLPEQAGDVTVHVDQPVTPT